MSLKLRFSETQKREEVSVEPVDENLLLLFRFVAGLLVCRGLKQAFDVTESMEVSICDNGVYIFDENNS
jgi:hypothetical protein